MNDTLEMFFSSGLPSLILDLDRTSWVLAFVLLSFFYTFVG